MVKTIQYFSLMRDLARIAAAVAISSLSGCALVKPVYREVHEPEPPFAELPSEAEVVEVAVAEDFDALTCGFERTTGSHLARRVCDTVRSRSERRERDMRVLERTRLMW